MTTLHRAILLPGGILPASLAYPDLIEALGDGVDARSKELEIYAGDAPPDDYSLRTEVDGIVRFADEAGFDRFHLVGYSGGGAASLAFCAAHPERLLSLTLNEPAWAGNDGQLTDDETRVWRAFRDAAVMPSAQMMQAFVEAQLADGVPMPPPPGPPAEQSPWMAQRPAGVRTFIKVFFDSVLDVERLRAFNRPVLFTLGGKSNPAYYRREAERLAEVFPDFTLDTFEDRHHFDPPHRIEPDRIARSLRALWERADRFRAAG
jgi:pimeloyl-ACP methyl ester carboxylesterase